MYKTSSPGYLSKSPYLFCFRIKVPRDLQSTIAKKRIEAVN